MLGVDLSYIQLSESVVWECMVTSVGLHICGIPSVSATKTKDWIEQLAELGGLSQGRLCSEVCPRVSSLRKDTVAAEKFMFVVHNQPFRFL